MSDSLVPRSYIDHVAELEGTLQPEAALQEAVGGEFEAVGKLEFYLLRSLGLRPGHFIVDVGCGSGRLARQLAPLSGIKYLGTDVVPRLIEGARSISGRDDWAFEVVDGTSIPCADNAADYVVFFSVLTHTSQEESFRYFLESARCLKVGGYLVLSFLEFRIQCHWETFVTSVHRGLDIPLTQFIDRDGIHAWARHSGLTVESIFDGDKGHIPIPEEILWENGNSMRDLGNLGQSVAVLRKRA